MSTLRSIDHNGGLDNFLTTSANGKLSEFGQKLKRKIKKAQEAAQIAPAAKTKASAETKAAA
jgi:hypothetical protein